MKKSILVLFVLAVALASCSSYTCPTYTKAPMEKKGVAEQRI
jgi:PBP1b-binding outer membrane lipoprotein LpoB